MSKTIRKMEMRSEIEKKGVVLKELLDAVRDIAAQLPDDAFRKPHDDDAGHAHETDSTCQIAQQSLKVASQLVNHAPAGNDPPPLRVLGKSFV
jgi:hypothetical protein